MSKLKGLEERLDGGHELNSDGKNMPLEGRMKTLSSS